MMSYVLRRFRPEQVRELTLVFILVAVVGFFATQITDYLSWRTFSDISTGLEVIAVVAVGQTLVVLTRNIDLSVGSVVGVVAYFVGTLLAGAPGLPPLAAVAIAVAIGCALGAVNGAIVALGRVPAVVATLGTLAIYRVALVELSGAKTVTTDSLPGWLLDLPRATLVAVGGFEIRVLVAVALLVVVVFQLVLYYLPYGRRLFAIGSNPDAARVAGLPIQRDVFVAFVLSGALAGLAGFLFLVRFGNITVVAGQGLELQVVAAVVVGGVNIFGGSGSMLEAFLGATLINVLQQSLIRWPAVSAFAQDWLLGLLILLAVASDKVILGRLRTIWVRARQRDDERAAAIAAEQAVRGA
jgi:rhamnose transport system permease protein